MKFALHILVSVSLMFCQLCASEDCNIFCTRENLPVCGRSESTGAQRTFSTVCTMNLYNCQKSADYVVVQRTECPNGQK